MCRIPWNDPTSIMKFLHAGALGIVCPMVNNRPEAEAFVGACHYAPQGNRSWGPVRIPFANPPEYKDWANENIATAVSAWCSDPATAAVTYGDISRWDTSQVMKMNNI